MERQEFENLTFKEQLEYVNQRKHMTVKQIAEEIKGMPPSSLSKIYAKKGYRRVKGLYVKTEKMPQLESTKDDLEELLHYKDQLIAMVLKNQQQSSNQLDFSFLEKYQNQSKKTITFDLPEEMVDQFNSFVVKRGYKKQAVLSFIVHNFLQSNK